VYQQGMKQVAILVAVLTLIGTAIRAEDAQTNAPLKIPAADAKNHIGTNGIVMGKIADVNRAERLVRLNFGQPFPKQTFTAVIFSAHTNQFPEVEKLKGQVVEVSGKLVEYRGRPQIILTSTNQLKVVEEGENKK
jgi:DNA/RNA endonuclease YhcR with UshA esterase domain